MQNKANLPAPQMNINTVLTKDYENKRLCARGKNKAKTNPICRGVLSIVALAKMEASGEAGSNPT